MIILTPNRRQAAFSQQLFIKERLSAQQSCWVSPEIYPLEVWLLQLWQLCLDHNLSVYRPLLTTTQQQILFEQIIQSANTGDLLRIKATAQNVIQAWNFLRQWQIDIKRVKPYAEFSADAAAFCQWIQQYLDWLETHQYYDLRGMVDVLITLLPNIAHGLPKQICLRGFNEFTPQYDSLFKRLRACGVEVMQDHLTVPGARVIKTSCYDWKIELNNALAWAADRLFNENMAQTIGIVIPNLEQVRDYVNNCASGLEPGWVNISAPLALGSYEMIATALRTLQLAEPVINYSDFSVILRSPFIADFMRAAGGRARLDRKLRANEKLEAKVSWQNLLHLLGKECPEVSAKIIAFESRFANLHGKHAPAYWVKQIQSLLQAWGWPGDFLTVDDHNCDDDSNCLNRNLEIIDNREKDLLACWQSLLAEYCQLNTIIADHGFTECLQYIRRLATETPFLPAETGVTKVHVLGLLEAEGLVFDHLWVCGMSRDNWPQAANPNPFIPLELQRQFDLPHSSPQRELLMAQKYTSNLQQGARNTVVFSYTKFVDDYAMQPSQLLAHIHEEKINFTQTATPFIPDPLEIWHDAVSTPYTETYISGGASVLRLQAQCEFRANAEIRLKAKPLQEPQTYLNPMQRGKLVHHVLENFWRKCHGHAELVAYTPDELENIIRKVIAESLQIWQRELQQILTNNYLMLESHRLYNLLSRWLEYESKRSPFAVAQLEHKTLINIGPLQINMIVDRIDQVDGNYVIIDYKTGETQVSHWFTDPIYDPQLPIYAVAALQPIAGVAFASLRAPEYKFIGIAADSDILPHVKVIDNWHTMLQEWLEKLQQTAQNFANGAASVNPFSPQVCNTCDLQALCRIYEQFYDTVE